MAVKRCVAGASYQPRSQNVCVFFLLQLTYSELQCPLNPIWPQMCSSACSKMQSVCRIKVSMKSGLMYSSSTLTSHSSKMPLKKAVLTVVTRLLWWGFTQGQFIYLFILYKTKAAAWLFLSRTEKHHVVVLNEVKCLCQRADVFGYVCWDIHSWAVPVPVPELVMLKANCHTHPTHVALTYAVVCHELNSCI